MGNNNVQGMKVPLIVVGVAVVVIAAGILVRTLNSPESPVAPESEPVSGLAPEPAPMPVPSTGAGPQIEFSSLAATDENGDNWRLGLKEIPPQLPEGGAKAGAPLLVKADVRGAGPYVSIGLIIEGQAGEMYEPGASRNGRTLSPPTFKVFDESGREIGSGSFEYG